MVDEEQEAVAAVMQQINNAWLEGHIEDIGPRVHPEIVIALPGFTGQIKGRDELLAGFRDYVQNATTHEFNELDRQVDVIGDTAVVHYRYAMVYELAGERYRATGRDLWVFHKQDTAEETDTKVGFCITDGFLEGRPG